MICTTFAGRLSMLIARAATTLSRWICWSFLIICVACSSANAEPELFVRLAIAAVNTRGGPLTYEIKIFGDGTVSYHGKEGTRVLGTATDKISMSKVRQIGNSLDKIGFFSMRARYYGPTEQDVQRRLDEQRSNGKRGTITLGLRDNAGRTLEARMRGVTKIVEFNSLAPESLLAMERELERVTNASRWTGLDGFNR